MPNERTTRIARSLRQRETDIERKLWRALRNRKAVGLKFRRQHSVGPFVIDFACVEANLLIEIDGYWHATRKDTDEERDAFLRDRGYDIVRFDIESETSNVDTLVERIAQEARSRINN